MDTPKKPTIDEKIASITRYINRDSFHWRLRNEAEAVRRRHKPEQRLQFFKKILYSLKLQQSEPDWVVISKQDQNDHDEIWKHKDPGPDFTSAADRRSGSSILESLIADNNPSHDLSKIGFMLYQLQSTRRLYQSRILGLESDIERYLDLETCTAGVAVMKEKIQFFEKTTRYCESVLDRYAKDLRLCLGFEGIHSFLSEGNTYSEEPKRPLRTGLLSIQVHSIKDIGHAATSSEESFEVSIQSDFEWTNRMASQVSHAGQAQEKEALFDFKEVDTHATIQLFLHKRDENTENPSTIGVLFLRALDIVNYSNHNTHEGSTSSDGAFNASSFTPINAWFPLAPAGKVYLTINFVETPRCAIQLPRVEQPSAQLTENRKGELSGHTFVIKEFDSEMRCSVCAEFLSPSSLAAQCTTCKTLCHVWHTLYSNWMFGFLVPPCLKNSSASSSSSLKRAKRKMDTLDEEDQYRSHQWVPFLNLSANWCFHCGYSLSLGQGNQEGANRQCEACNITCHAQCQGIVGKRCDLENAPPSHSSLTGIFEPISEWLPQSGRTREPRSKTGSRT